MVLLVSLINYDKMSKMTDARIVKTRRAIFRALIELLEERPLEAVTITELCSRAMINRKTFYVHYKSPRDVLDDLEYHIIAGFFDQMSEHEIVTAYHFKPYELILLINTLVELDRKYFDILFPYLKSGTFLRKLGAEVGRLAFRLMAERPGHFSTKVYPYSLVFAITGLLTSYFDWVDFGRQFSIEELAEISSEAMEKSIREILS